MTDKPIFDEAPTLSPITGNRNNIIESHHNWEVYHTGLSLKLNQNNDWIEEKQEQVSLDAVNTATNASSANTSAMNAETAKNEAVEAKEYIEDYIIPEEATYSHEDIDSRNQLQDNAVFNGFGYTKRIDKKDKWEETDTPNLIKDKKLGSARFLDRLIPIAAGDVRLPTAPFSTDDDELLDYSENEMVVQQSHKAGDIILCSSHTTIDSLSSSNVSPVHDEEEITFVNSSRIIVDTTPEEDSNYGGCKILMASQLYAGQTIRIRYKIINNDELNLYQIAYFTPVKYESGSNSSASIQVDTTFRIKQDITDPYLYFKIENDKGVFEIKDVFIDVIEQSYQAINQTNAGDLLTDENKFQKIDYISRQDIILLTKTGYKTFRGYRNFEGQTSNKAIAEAYGWTFSKGLSQVNNLEVVNDEGSVTVINGEVIICGLVPRLNAGAYHPVFNAFGTQGFNKKDGSSNSYIWYLDNAYEPTSTLETFTEIQTLREEGTIDSNISRRPDGRFYDKIYFEGINGLIYKPSYTIEPCLNDLLKNEENKLINGDDMNESCGIETYFINEQVSNTMVNFQSGGTIILNTNGGINKSIVKAIDVNADRILIRLLSDKTKALFVQRTKEWGDGNGYELKIIANTTGNSAGDYWNNVFNNAPSEVIIYATNKQLLTQGKNTTIDVVGNPSKYESTDADATVGDGGTVDTNALVWNGTEGKMYRALANDVNVDDADSSSSDYEYVIGRYPNNWYNRLDNGLSLPFNLALMGQDGNTLIPNGTARNILLSKKAISFEQALYGINGLLSNREDFIDNTGSIKKSYVTNAILDSNTNVTAHPESITLISYTFQNKPLQQSSQLPIQQVASQVIGSNSFSWRKGGGLTESITEKIATNDGLNGFKSRTLNDTYVNEVDYIASNNTSISGGNGTSILIDKSTNVGFVGRIYIRTGGDFLGLDATIYDNFSNTDYWEDITLVPTHGNISLDNSSDSPASKAFVTIAKDEDEYVLQVFGQEIRIDVDNGSGDNETFKQLSNGTLTDLNGKPIRTFVGIKRLGVYDDK